MQDRDFGFKEGDLAQLLAIFKQAHHLQKVVLFGSRALGNFKLASDVDLALFTSDEKCANHVSGLLNDETLLPYKFDVVDIKNIDNQDLIEHINRVGIEIFTQQKVSK